jgi:hypothetical protein
VFSVMQERNLKYYLDKVHAPEGDLRYEYYYFCRALFKVASNIETAHDLSCRMDELGGFEKRDYGLIDI